MHLILSFKAFRCFHFHLVNLFPCSMRLQMLLAHSSMLGVDWDLLVVKMMDIIRFQLQLFYGCRFYQFSHDLLTFHWKSFKGHLLTYYRYKWILKPSFILSFINYFGLLRIGALVLLVHTPVPYIIFLLGYNQCGLYLR